MAPAALSGPPGQALCGVDPLRWTPWSWPHRWRLCGPVAGPTGAAGPAPWPAGGRSHWWRRWSGSARRWGLGSSGWSPPPAWRAPRRWVGWCWRCCPAGSALGDSGMAPASRWPASCWTGSGLAVRWRPPAAAWPRAAGCRGRPGPPGPGGRRSATAGAGAWIGADDPGGPWARATIGAVASLAVPLAGGCRVWRGSGCAWCWSAGCAWRGGRYAGSGAGRWGVLAAGVVPSSCWRSAAGSGRLNQ